MPGMMDRGSEYLGKGRSNGAKSPSNGAKSPSNASNGHFSEESASDEEHGIASNTPRLSCCGAGEPTLIFIYLYLFYFI